jgi:hypothetical protein
MSKQPADGQIPGSTSLEDAIELAHKLAEQGHVSGWFAVVGKNHRPRRTPRTKDRWSWGIRFLEVPAVEDLGDGWWFEPLMSCKCTTIAPAADRAA